MAIFEKVNKFKNIDLPMPTRATKNAAGYDIAVAEDVIIPPFSKLYNSLKEETSVNNRNVYDLTAMSTLTKGNRPTLVTTGLKCKLKDNEYLELVIRSSSPLKYLLFLANSEGIIDADYYNNPSNEGEIFFQLINLSPVPIKLYRGDVIGQGIIREYIKTENDDDNTKLREGGFGSTTDAAQPLLQSTT